MKIKNKKGIRETFTALPGLKEVHIVPSGEHYFTHAHAVEAAGGDEEQVKTLAPDAAELKEKAPAGKKEEAAA